MKIFISILIIVCTKECFAVGWEEISQENIESRGIFVNVELDARRNCNEVTAMLPNKLFFNGLGERRLWEVQYKKIEEKNQGWQLTSKGTQLKLPTIIEAKHTKIATLCLSDSDLKIAYLSALYVGLQGSPSMVILLKLGDYK